MNKNEDQPAVVEKFEFKPVSSYEKPPLDGMIGIHKGISVIGQPKSLKAAKKEPLPPTERNEDAGKRGKIGDVLYAISKSGAWVRITPKIEHTVTDNKAKLRRVKKGKF